MKIVFLILFIGISITYGQKETPNLPIDSQTNKISYSEVVNVDSLSKKQELYSRAREWFARAFKSSTNVIQMEDKENGKIVGKALMQVYHKALGSNYPSGCINYTVSIYLKDGRYKYQFSDFYHSGSGNVPDYGPCEQMISTTRKTMGMSYQKTFNYYLYQMDNDIKDLILSLKLAMKINSSNSKKSDW